MKNTAKQQNFTAEELYAFRVHVAECLRTIKSDIKKMENNIAPFNNLSEDMRELVYIAHDKKKETLRKLNSLLDGIYSPVIVL